MGCSWHIVKVVVVVLVPRIPGLAVGAGQPKSSIREAAHLLGAAGSMPVFPTQGVLYKVACSCRRVRGPAGVLMLRFSVAYSRRVGIQYHDWDTIALATKFCAIRLSVKGVVSTTAQVEDSFRIQVLDLARSSPCTGIRRRSSLVRGGRSSMYEFPDDGGLKCPV